MFHWNVQFGDYPLRGGRVLALGFALLAMAALPAAAQMHSIVTILRYANPVTPYVEGIRGALWGGFIVGPAELIYMAVVGPAAAVLGLWVLNRHEDRLAIEL